MVLLDLVLKNLGGGACACVYLWARARVCVWNCMNSFEDTKKTRDQRDKTMADKLMYILNDDKQNYPFWRLQLVVETFEHLT